MNACKSFMSHNGSSTPHLNPSNSPREVEVEKNLYEIPMANGFNPFSPSNLDVTKSIFGYCIETDPKLFGYRWLERLAQVCKSFYQVINEVLKDELKGNYDAKNPLMPFKQEFADPIYFNPTNIVPIYFFCLKYPEDKISQAFIENFKYYMQQSIQAFINKYKCYKLRNRAGFNFASMRFIIETKNGYGLSGAEIKNDALASSFVLIQFLEIYFKECLSKNEKSHKSHKQNYIRIIAFLSLNKFIPGTSETIDSLIKYLYLQYYNASNTTSKSLKSHLLFIFKEFAVHSLINRDYCPFIEQIAIEALEDYSLQGGSARLLQALRDTELITLNDQEIEDLTKYIELSEEVFEESSDSMPDLVACYTEV